MDIGPPAGGLEIMIIYLYGADTFRSRQKLNAIMEKFRRDVDPTGYNLTRLNAMDASTDDIQRCLHATSFLAPRRMIVLERALQNTSNDVLNLLANVIDRGIARHDDVTEPLVVFWEDKSAGTRTKKQNKKTPQSPDPGKTQQITTTKLHALLCKSPYAQDFPLLEDKELERWIIAETNARGVMIESDAVELLSEWIGSDLWALTTEIDKCATYAKAIGHQSITRKHVTQLVVGNVDAPIWTILNHLHESRTAFLLVDMEAQLNSGSHALEILATLIKDNETLMNVAFDTVPKTMHPFVQKKTRARLRTLSPSYIPMSVSALLNADTKLKSSNYPPRLLLDLLALTLIAHPSLKQ